MKILQVGILVVYLSLRRISGRPSWRDVGQCGSGLACGPECQKLCLTQHNYYRALHNLSPLQCDPELAESAQAWTDMQAQKGQLKPSPWRNLGQVAESISWKQWGWEGMADTRAAVPGAVRSWYSEKKGSIVNRTATPEHYHTIVRPDITRLGCGIHVIPGDGTYVTSQYGTMPGGNVLNDEIQIPPARDSEPACQIKSGQREKCGNISSPYVTPDDCLEAGCCYDDVFRDEPDVNWYSSEGSTWCYKGKNHDTGQQTPKSNDDLEKQKLDNTEISVNTSAVANNLEQQTSLDDNAGTDGDCYGNSCYSFNEEGQMWTANREECQRRGGDLVSIETEGEWAFIKNKIQELNNPLRNEWHIGLKKEGSTWKWVNGAPLTITHWQRGEPYGDGPYVVMAKNYPPGTQGEFNDLPDWKPSGYICEREKGGNTSPTVASGPTSSSPTIESEGSKNCYGSSCYSFNEEGKMWTENREECRRRGEDLVSMETEGEWAFIKDKIQELNNPLRNEWHIGLKKEGSTWKWVNGVPLTITHWQRRQPSGDGLYGLMAKNYPPGTQGEFNDIPDWIPGGYICEGGENTSPTVSSGPTSSSLTIKPEGGNNCYSSSCYSFNEEGRRWTENREECKNKGGDLVSMDSDGEWAFINDRIQRLSNEFHDEWHIGLTKIGSTWKWVNGAPLKVSHWQRGQPSGDGPYVVIARNYPPEAYGEFNDLPDYIYRGYICEIAQGGETSPTIAVGTTPTPQIPTGKITSAVTPSRAGSASNPPGTVGGATPGPPGPPATGAIPSITGTASGATPGPPGTVTGAIPSPPGTITGVSPGSPGPIGSQADATSGHPSTATGATPGPPGTVTGATPGPPGTIMGATHGPPGPPGPLGAADATPVPPSTATDASPGPPGTTIGASPGPSVTAIGASPGPPGTATGASPGPPGTAIGATLGPPGTATGASPGPPGTAIGATLGPPDTATGASPGPPGTAIGATPGPPGTATGATPGSSSTAPDATPVPPGTSTGATSSPSGTAIDATPGPSSTAADATPVPPATATDATPDPPDAATHAATPGPTDAATDASPDPPGTATSILPGQ